jgi:predicted ABC-type ATPase
MSTFWVVLMLIVGGVGAYFYVDQQAVVGAGQATVRAQVQCKSDETQLRVDLASDDVTKQILVADGDKAKADCAKVAADQAAEAAQAKQQGSDLQAIKNKLFPNK